MRDREGKSEVRREVGGKVEKDDGSAAYNCE